MVLSRNYCDINIKIENNNIEKTDCIKLLGVLIDKDLNFTHQAKHVTVRSSRQVNALGRLRKMLDERSKMMIVNAFILSNFDYCNSLLYHCNIRDLRKIEALLKRCLRYVFNDFKSDYKELLLKANCVPLYVTMQRKILVTVHKIINDCFPPFKNDFYAVKEQHYEMRNKTLVQPHYSTVRFGYKSLRYTGAMLYNNLPNDFRLLGIDDFKLRSKVWKPDCKCGNCFICTM